MKINGKVISRKQKKVQRVARALYKGNTARACRIAGVNPSAPWDRLGVLLGTPRWEKAPPAPKHGGFATKEEFDCAFNSAAEAHGFLG